MVKAYFTACEQAFPAQRAQLRRIALALCRGGVERMEELCRLYAQTPERLMDGDSFHRHKKLAGDCGSVQAVSKNGRRGRKTMKQPGSKPRRRQSRHMWLWREKQRRKGIILWMVF